MRILIVCFILLVIPTFSQTDKIKQLTDDGLSEKEIKLSVGLLTRDTVSNAPPKNVTITVSLVLNSKERYINGRYNFDFVPKLDFIGTLYPDLPNSKHAGFVPGTVPFSFFLFYNKEYFFEVAAPGFVSQKFAINTHLPLDTLKRLKTASRYSYDKINALRGYNRFLNLIPCKKGFCTDTSKVQLMVSYSPFRSRFDMVINKPNAVEENIFDSAAPLLSTRENKSPLQTPVTAATDIQGNEYSPTKVVSPYPGVSALRIGNDTLNTIDVENLRQGVWLHFGDEAGDSKYSNDSKYYEGVYINDHRIGNWVRFFPNSDTAAVIHFDQNSLLDGFRYYYASGSLAEDGTWNPSQEKLNGPYKEYYENGSIHKECLYDNRGLKNGTQSVYYVNGNTIVTAHMQGDTLQGYLNYYLEDGQIYLQQLYDRGVLVSEKYYGAKSAFPKSLRNALGYLLVKNDSIIAIKINHSLEELSKIDNNYPQLLTLREQQVEAAGLLLTQKEKELLLARRKLTRAELESTLHQSEVKKQRIIIVGAGIMLICCIIIFLLVFRSNRQKKKAYRLLLIQKEELHLRKKEIEEKNKEILDSINYSKRLQNAILPSLKSIREIFPEFILLYLPKDIVAGDFYWMEKVNDSVLFAVADCTGHGVPGAMVSVVCSTALNRVVNELHITDPGQILDKVRELILNTYSKSEEQVKDGMDISLANFDLKKKELKWAGANNPIWIVRNGSLTELPADRQPVGQTDYPKPFSTHQFQLADGDIVYLSSDGFADQFGEIKNKKFKTANLKKLLISISSKSVDEQQQLIHQTFQDWKGSLEQVDDVCVLGVKF